jgi:hypothetical protein
LRLHAKDLLLVARGLAIPKIPSIADAGGFHFDPMLGSASLIRAVNATILQDRFDMRRKKMAPACVVPEPLVSTLTLGNEKLEERGQQDLVSQCCPYCGLLKGNGVVLLGRNEVCYGAIANSLGNRSVRFFKNTLERKFVLVGKRQNVGYLFLGFFTRVGTTNRFPLRVGAKHVFARLGKLISKKTSSTRTTNSIGVSLSFKSATS